MKLFSKKQSTEETMNQENTDKADKQDTGKKSPNINSMKPRSEDMAVILKWAMPMILLLIVWILVRFAGSVINEPGAIQLSQQTARLVEIQNNIDLKTNEYKDLQSQNSAKGEYAYYTGNTKADDDIAVTFFEHICTWNNSVMYEDLREELLSTGYEESDSVMRTLLPEVSTYFNEAVGKWQNSIDVNGDNLKFESLSTYPIAVEDGRRSYAGILEVSTKDTSEQGMNKEYFGYVYVRYVIENGKCCQVEAEALVD